MAVCTDEAMLIGGEWREGSDAARFEVTDPATDEIVGSAMSEIDLSSFDALTFDCYGTLIDWERGILNALQPVLSPQAIDVDEDELLESLRQARDSTRGRRVPRIPRDPLRARSATSAPTSASPRPTTTSPSSPNPSASGRPSATQPVRCGGWPSASSSA
jgi:hypothetical protein